MSFTLQRGLRVLAWAGSIGESIPPVFKASSFAATAQLEVHLIVVLPLELDPIQLKGVILLLNGPVESFF